VLREVAKVTRVYIYDAPNKCNEVGLHSDDHGVRFYAYLMPKMTPTRANSCALGGSHETDYYTLNMLKPDVRDHSIGIRAPDLGGVAINDLWDRV